MTRKPPYVLEGRAGGWEEPLSQEGITTNLLLKGEKIVTFRGKKEDFKDILVLSTALLL